MSQRRDVCKCMFLAPSFNPLLPCICQLPSSLPSSPLLLVPLRSATFHAQATVPYHPTGNRLPSMASNHKEQWSVQYLRSNAPFHLSSLCPVCPLSSIARAFHLCILHLSLLSSLLLFPWSSSLHPFCSSVTCLSSLPPPSHEERSLPPVLCTRWIFSRVVQVALFLCASGLCCIAVLFFGSCSDNALWSDTLMRHCSLVSGNWLKAPTYFGA